MNKEAQVFMVIFMMMIMFGAYMMMSSGDDEGGGYGNIDGGGINNDGGAVSGDATYNVSTENIDIDDVDGGSNGGGGDDSDDDDIEVSDVFKTNASNKAKRQSGASNETRAGQANRWGFNQNKMLCDEGHVMVGFACIDNNKKNVPSSDCYATCRELSSDLSENITGGESTVNYHDVDMSNITSWRSIGDNSNKKAPLRGWSTGHEPHSNNMNNMKLRAYSYDMTDDAKWNSVDLSGMECKKTENKRWDNSRYNNWVSCGDTLEGSYLNKVEMITHRQSWHGGEVFRGECCKHPRIK